MKKNACKTTVLLAVLSVWLLPMKAVAFDGHRKGFVMGFGLGVSQLVYWEVKELGKSGTAFGRSSNLVIGYAWNNANILVLSGDYRNDWFLNDLDIVSRTGIEGVSYYHFWGGGRGRWFSRAGFGASYVGSSYRGVGGDGFGILIGCGKEVFKQILIGTTLFWGNGSDPAKYPASAYSLNVTATIIAY